MWDNPRLLNAAAGFLVGVAALAFGFAALQMLMRSSLFPLREIEVTTPLERTSKAQIEAAVQGRVTGNFFAVEISEIRASIERLPWVRRVGVRRAWPDRLQIALEEHVPLARWGDDALINAHGERFSGTTQAALPVFIAPPGTEFELSWRYARFARALEPLGERLERVVLTPRFAWQLRLGNGLQLMLGRDADAAEERLRRFVEVYPAFPRGTRHDYVDLRYPNGFVVRSPEREG
ncbi:MAG TPA: cell division protein FtsQ/DivIB [Burkholderiales bacterium]|nr:cell division protein FtsQ/DivIB [Burkholderiales bacterium]